MCQTNSSTEPPSCLSLQEIHLEEMRTMTYAEAAYNWLVAVPLSSGIYSPVTKLKSNPLCLFVFLYKNEWHIMQIQPDTRRLCDTITVPTEVVAEDGQRLLCRIPTEVGFRQNTTQVRIRKKDYVLLSFIMQMLELLTPD